jgi:hypothetical protein
MKPKVRSNGAGHAGAVCVRFPGALTASKRFVTAPSSSACAVGVENLELRQDVLRRVSGAAVAA